MNRKSPDNQLQISFDQIAAEAADPPKMTPEQERAIDQLVDQEDILRIGAAVVKATSIADNLPKGACLGKWDNEA